MAWARSYLKKAGLLDNIEQGVWSLTERGRNSTAGKPSDASSEGVV